MTEKFIISEPSYLPQGPPSMIQRNPVEWNVHCLCPVPDDVDHFESSVNPLSAFAYENHLKSIKKLEKGPTNPIAKVFSRIT